MKTLIQSITLFALLIFVSIAPAQNILRRVPTTFDNSKFSFKQHSTSEVGQPSISQGQGKHSSFPLDPLSSLVAVPNASSMGINGLFDLQTNGRGLHNIQIDPSDPNKIHCCVMTTTTTDPSDTNGSAYPSRRVMYTYSGDGGITWTNPKAVSGTVRTGYPDMVLIKRGSSYFPIIAAHRYAPGSTTIWESAIFLDTASTPGLGKFVEVDCDRTASDGTDKDLLWPVIGLSNDNATLYMISDFSNQTNANAMDFMEFGTFTLANSGTSATWNGWKAQPGGGDGQKGYSENGKHVLRVGSDGRIGVVWVNPDNSNSDHSMYFVESTDGGKTWPTTVNALFPPVGDANNNRAMCANNGLDFFYDGTTPHFVWEVDEMVWGTGDSLGVYYPYTGQIFYWDGNLGDVKCLNYNDNRAYTVLSVPINGQTAKDSVNYLYQNPTFSVANNSTVLQAQPPIDFPHFASVELPTFARTANSNFFSVFYEAISDGDYGTITDRDGGTHTSWFSGIYYQYTTDGGASWSEPKTFRVNTAGDPNSLDYRYPEAPSISPNVKNSNFPVIFQADSLPGIFNSNSSADDGAGYDFNYWFYQQYLISGVSSNNVSAPTSLMSQNFPNPFTVSTTIPLVMKNDDVVTLSVTDMLGREVAIIYHGRLSTGSHQIPFNAPNLGTGIYTYTLKTSTGNISRTMSLVK
jgi:hypothetical protein